jgi:hypothetical protein
LKNSDPHLRSIEEHGSTSDPDTARPYRFKDLYRLS